MSDWDEDDRDSERGALSDDLPPVDPPSAGFILRLFFVPALIVAAVIGIWALFGRMASAEQDWEYMVTQIRNPNPRVRWPVAHQLAHVLSADQTRNSQSQRLSNNPHVVDALTELFAQNLNRSSTNEEDLKNLEFLTRLLGLLDSPDVVLPQLQKAMTPGNDRAVRKDAITSVAIIANRMSERGTPLENAAMVDDLVDVSTDTDPLMRQLGAYTLGFFPTKASRDRLTVMLEDPDVEAQVNAAIAFARQGLSSGYPVFRRVLSNPTASNAPASSGQPHADGRQQVDFLDEREQTLALVNSLKAVGMLADRFDAEQRDTLERLIAPIGSHNETAAIRDAAVRTLHALQTQTPLDV